MYSILKISWQISREVNCSKNIFEKSKLLVLYFSLRLQNAKCKTGQFTFADCIWWCI